MRKLKIFFITLACLLVSNVAFTLGVGHIKVNSALSEPLDAEIQLFSVRPGESENIRVSLATLKEFTAAGIDRTLNLSRLKFKVVEKGDGNAYIKVYSDRPIREPFLDFLVDIDWPSGRLLREYTILLDPPIFAQRKAAPVQTPEVAAPTRIVREPAPAPTVARTAPVPSAPVVRQSKDDLFPRIEIENSAAPAIDRSPRVVAPAYSGDTYKVQKSQTLWSIADAVRPDSSIGVSQMMLALQKENPEAFTNNNINGLKSGAILRIPDITAIQAIDRREAVALAKQQNLQWRAAQANLTGADVASGATSTTASAATTPQAPVKTESTVKLVTPDAGVAGTQQGVGDDEGAAAEKLALINEQLASKSKENDKLQERVRSLEDQINSMERLLELKDDSLSELQSKLGDATPVPTPAFTSEPDVEAVKPEPAKPVKKPVVPDDSKINPYALDDIPKVKLTPKPVTRPTPKPASAEPGLFDDPAILAVMIGVAVAVLALIWLIVQRRRNNMQFPESILSSKPAPSTTTTASAANAETSLLSDFAPSAMDGALETDASEVDPSAEADVYIAYGKHQQAEELLLSAIEEEPERLDLRLKLMEVYHAKGDADAFLAQATELNNAMDDQNTALWEKAVVMGKELCPGNALFGEADSSDEDDFSDLEGIGELDDDLELSLDMDEVASATDADELSIDSDDELSLDMELESLDSGSETAPETEADTDTDTELVLDSEDLSLDDELQTRDVEEPVESDLNIDIDDLALDIEETSAEESVESGVDTLEMDADLSDMDVDTMLESEPVDGEDDEALLGMDEVATKLDLAKAYIDMGDPDGARAILDEVLTEGNEAQQSEAKGLIDQL